MYACGRGGVRVGSSRTHDTAPLPTVILCYLIANAPPNPHTTTNHHHPQTQIQAIARGLYALVPRDTLLLLTWRELETLVRGSPTFDLAFWRRHTTYSGYTEEVRVGCVWALCV